MPTDFAEKLRAGRKRLGLTQVQAAERAGVGQARWSLYESGRRTPPLDTARRLLEVVGLRLEIRPRGR